MINRLFIIEESPLTSYYPSCIHLSLLMNTLLDYKPLTWGGIFFAIITVISGLASADEKPLKKVLLPVPELLTDSANELAVISEEELEGMSYQELEDSRIPRQLLLDYLMVEGKLRESPKGTIDFLDHLNPIAKKAVKDENLVRKKIFSLIAKRERRAFASVGREFHESLMATKEAESKSEAAPAPALDINPSLKISAPISIGQSLMSNLVAGYLATLGYGEMQSQIIDGVTRLIGKRSFGSGYLAVDVETRAGNSVTQSRDSMAIFEINSSIPPNMIALEGLAIVVHPDNPVTSLTVSQIASVFFGQNHEME